MSSYFLALDLSDDAAVTRGPCCWENLACQLHPLAPGRYLQQSPGTLLSENLASALPITPLSPWRSLQWRGMCCAFRRFSPLFFLALLSFAALILRRPELMQDESHSYLGVSVLFSNQARLRVFRLIFSFKSVLPSLLTRPGFPSATTMHCKVSLDSMCAGFGNQST
jgi:hypothetical protein